MKTLKITILAALCSTIIAACENEVILNDVNKQLEEDGKILVNGGWDAALNTAKDADYLSQKEKDIIFELNKLRHDPVKWCKEAGLPMLDGLTPEQEFVEDKYGRGYTRSYPMNLLYPKRGLWLAAFDNNHNYWCIRSGTGHSEWSGRVDGRYGRATGDHFVGENAGQNGGDSPQAIVAAFVRDGGVSDKGHRKMCMEQRVNVVGVSVMEGYVTMDFARDFTDNEPLEDIAWAARTNGNAASTTIDIVFSKPVALNDGDVQILPQNIFATTTATCSLGALTKTNDDGMHWQIAAPTAYGGDIAFHVEKSGVRTWGRRLVVSRNSSFNSLDALKEFLNDASTQHGSLDKPYDATITNIADGTPCEKIAALYTAIGETGKYTNITIQDYSISTWCRVSGNAGTAYITGLVLPMQVADNGDITPTAIADSALMGADFPVLSSILSFTITAVGKHAFLNSPLLKSAAFPHLTSIGEGAYDGCNVLSWVVIGSNVDDATMENSGLPTAMRSVYNAGKVGGFDAWGWIGYQKKADGTWAKETH